MPNGYTDAMRIFNKLLKPVSASLHELDYESSVYVMIVYCWLSHLKNILIMYFPQYLLQELGFVIHPTKSIFVPT